VRANAAFAASDSSFAFLANATLSSAARTASAEYCNAAAAAAGTGDVVEAVGSKSSSVCRSLFELRGSIALFSSFCFVVIPMASHMLPILVGVSFVTGVVDWYPLCLHNVRNDQLEIQLVDTTLTVLFRKQLSLWLTVERADALGYGSWRLRNGKVVQNRCQLSDYNNCDYQFSIYTLRSLK
jgi:hypothetical protein